EADHRRRGRKHQKDDAVPGDSTRDGRLITSTVRLLEQSWRNDERGAKQENQAPSRSRASTRPDACRRSGVGGHRVPSPSAVHRKRYRDGKSNEDHGELYKVDPGRAQKATSGKVRNRHERADRATRKD